MKLSFNDIIGKHKDKPALVIAKGPSLNPYLDKLQYYKDNGFILFSVNHWFAIFNTIPHYWTLASVPFPGTDSIYFHTPRLNSIQTTVIYADSVDTTDRKWIEDNLYCDYLPYDQRHFKGKRCRDLINSDIKDMGGFDPSEPCCKHIIKDRLTIQETLQQYSGYNKHYKTGDSVIIHALANAVIMNCNPIYLIGADLDYRLGYAGNPNRSGSNWPLIPNLFDDIKPRILEDFEIIRESAKNLGIDIINLNKNSTYNTFTIGDIK